MKLVLLFGIFLMYKQSQCLDQYDDIDEQQQDEDESIDEISNQFNDILDEVEDDSNLQKYGFTDMIDKIKKLLDIDSD